MTVMINDLDLVPAEPNPPGEQPAQQPPPSPARIAVLVERTLAARDARTERLRAY